MAKTGFWSSVAGSVAPYAGGFFAALGNRLFGLSRAEKEANAFTAQQNQEAMAFEERMAQNAMDFEASEAQKNREFEAQQSNTSWQRGVMDMRNAGLNPALAYSQGGASAMNGAVASGFSASGHAGSSVTPGTSLSDLIQLAQFKSQTDLMKSQAGLYNAQARDVNASADLKEIDAKTRGELNTATLNEKLENIENLKESRNLMKYQREVLGPAQAALMKAQKEAAKSQASSLDASRVYTDWTNEFYKRNGHWPGTNATSFFWNVIMGMENNRGPGHDVPAQTGAIPFNFGKD